MYLVVTWQCNVSNIFSILTKWSFSSSQSQTRLVQDLERDLIICTKHELQCHFFLEITDISWYYSLQQEENICVCAITITITMFHVLPAHSLPRAGAGLLAAALYLLCPGVPAPATGHCTGPPRQRGLHRMLLTQAPCHQCNAIWSNDHARPEPSPFTEATEPTVHSAISALLSFSISLPIYSVTKHHNKLLLFNNFPRQNSAYVLSGWVTAPPPVDGALWRCRWNCGPVIWAVIAWSTR